MSEKLTTAAEYRLRRKCQKLEEENAELRLIIRNQIPLMEVPLNDFVEMVKGKEKLIGIPRYYATFHQSKEGRQSASKVLAK